MNIDFFLEDENPNISREQIEKLRGHLGGEKQFLFDFLNQRPTPKEMEPYQTLRRMSIPYEADSSQKGQSIPTLRSGEVLQALDRAAIVYQKENHPVQRNGVRARDTIGIEVVATIPCPDGQRHFVAWHFNQLNELIVFMTSPRSK